MLIDEGKTKYEEFLEINKVVARRREQAMVVDRFAVCKLCGQKVLKDNLQIHLKGHENEGKAFIARCVTYGSKILPAMLPKQRNTSVL